MALGDAGEIKLSATIDTRGYDRGASKITSTNSKIESSVASASSAMNKSHGSAGDSADNMANRTQSSGAKIAAIWGAVSGIAQNVVSRAFDTVRNSISGAVDRVDTLNNFPKIMQNLGYSSSDAATQVQRMSDRLQGLPTSLDAMTGMVQKIAPLTSSLGEATDISLAFNDALLAGGKSTELQSNALEQYSQMLSVGKVDMQAWRSVVNAMPGQMDQLSKSILGNNANQMDLYNAMKTGKVTFKQFNDAVVDLDKNGSGHFASFQQQAKDATSGIKTGWMNMQNAINRGLADIIQSIGASNIANSIASIGTGFEKMAKWISGGITNIVNELGASNIQSYISGLGQSFADAGKAIGDIISDIVKAIGTSNIKNAVLDIAKSFDSIAKSLAPAIKATAEFARVAAKMPAVQTAVAGLAGGFVVLKTAMKIKGTIDGVTAGLAAFRKAQGAATTAQAVFNAVAGGNPLILVAAAVAAVTAALVYFFTQTETGRKAWSSFIDWLQNAWEGVSNFFSNLWDGITNVFNSAVDAVKGAWDGVTGFFTGIWNGITDGVNSAVEGIKNAWNGIGQFFSNLWNGITNGVKTAWNAVTGVISSAAGFVGRIAANILTVLGAIPVWLMQTLLKGIDRLFSMITGLITGWFTNSTGFIHTVLGGILDYVTTFWNVVHNVVQAGIDLVRTVVVTVVKLLQGDWQGAWTTISTYFSGVWNNIVAFFTGIGTTFTNIWNMVWTGVSNTWNTIWGAVSSFFMGIWNNIVAFVSPIVQSISNTIDRTISSIQATWNAVWGAISSFVSSIWGSISGTVGGAINTVSGTISGVLGSIQATWNSVWSSVSGFLGGIWNGIVGSVRGGINQVSSVVGSIRGTVLGAVSGAGSWLSDTGHQIISGLIGGIEGAFGWLKNTITNMGHNVLDWAKSVLHIGSPSKVFRDQVGKWIPAGIQVGVDKAMPSLKTDITDSLMGLVPRPYQMSRVIDTAASNIQPALHVPSSPTSMPVQRQNSVTRTVEAPITINSNNPQEAANEVVRMTNLHLT